MQSLLTLNNAFCSHAYSFLPSGQDYSITAGGLLTFTPGTDRQRSVNISLLQDQLVEVNESFSIVFSSDDSQVLTPTQSSQLLIIDNDGMGEAGNWMVGVRHNPSSR